MFENNSTAMGKGVNFVRLKRTDYDELTHRMRHLQTLSRAVSIRTQRLEKMIFDLSLELNEKHKEILSSVESLDSLILRLEGRIANCQICDKRGGCDGDCPDT